jgi:ABC-2 type transport system ATP-binding protein
VLDEPTTGLDPAGMRDMRGLVRTLASEGITVLLSSHLMHEVEALCDRVAIISRGRIGYEGALAELLDTAGGRYRLEAADPARAAEQARAAAGVRDVSVVDGRIEFAADRAAVGELTLALGRAGIGIHALVPARPDLEAVFFAITEGREAP